MELSGRRYKYPAKQKYQVVEMLQNRGHLTAMTGDGEQFRDLTSFWLIGLGVNDAPSLKRVMFFTCSLLFRPV